MALGRRIALAGLLLLVTLLAAPAYFFVRATWFAPTFDVPSIAATLEYQDPALLAEAWKLPVASLYAPGLLFQANGSTCGPASLANLLRASGRAGASEADVLDGTGKCPLGVCLGGLTLDELAEVARDKSGMRVTVLRDLSLADFRAHLARANDPSRRYLINFHRGPLFGRGGGHHSPLGGYLADRDLVLVIDVNQKFSPWLVSAERLHAAMDTVDTSSGRKRGLLLLEELPTHPR